MDPDLPVLVTRLPDRRALAQLLQAALRHAVTRVRLQEAPRPGAHRLELCVSGSPSVYVLAEPAGPEEDDHTFPLRLRPMDAGHAAELLARLEAELPGRAAASDDAGPILRAMSGSAPPPVAGLTPAEGSVADDPRRTVPSALWSRLHASLEREAVRAVAPPPVATLVAPPALDDDPRRTARSTVWALLEGEERAPAPHGADDEPSLSILVDFEPDPSPHAADPPARGPVLALVDEDEVDGPVTGEDSPPPAFAPVHPDSFFDEDFANLPMGLHLDDGGGAASPSYPAPAVDSPRALAEAAFERLATASTIPPPLDEEDGATLIRPPGQASLRPARAPVPAAGTPASEDARTAAPTSSIAGSDRSGPRSSSRSPAGSARRKKTTRTGKATADKKKPTTRHPADGDFLSAETRLELVPSSRRPQAPIREVGDPLLGRKIADGKYAIAEAIGSGAAGAVYKATHRELRRTVAIKVLHPHYQQDPHFMKSFRGEALAASQLDHPNVMRVLDFGQEPDGLVYIVMEFLFGRTLQSLLDEERRLQTDRAVEIMTQVCAALSVAHDNGIIHRDIKPDNIMLVSSRNDEGGTFELVKVCDFGIAALQNPTREDAELGLAENFIAGTPEYMSPEQARGREIDARSDVYACGICLYELVTGRPPFLGEHPAEIMIKQLEEEPRPPSLLVKGLDSLVEEIILRAIQKEPHKRQQSARELRVELKEILDPENADSPHDDDERSIVENVPVLDDPASGFPGFFMALASSILRVGRFERGHPEAAQAMKDLTRATKAALRGRRELSFARRDSSKLVGFSVMTGHGEIVDLRRLLGPQLHGSFGEPFAEALIRKGIAAFTLREGIPDAELQATIELLLGTQTRDALQKELLPKPLRSASLLFAADVLGRDRKLSWKVGLCVARLARDLRALSNSRGMSLKKMREVREDLVAGVARLLTKGDEVRQFLFNADLVDESVANLRAFSGFRLAPLVFDRLLEEPCAEAVRLLIADHDAGVLDARVVTGLLRSFAVRLLAERSPRSDAAVTELYRRSIVSEAEVPRDLLEQIRAESLADALVREPSQFLRTLDLVHDPDDYGREVATLEAAMAVLARRAEAPALLAAVSALARHAKGTGKPNAREGHALRTMKSIIDRARLVPIASAVLTGPVQQREAGRQLLVLAGSAGAHALFSAREALTDASARPLWVSTFRDTGPAGWSLLAAVLPRMEVQSETDITLVEDLLRALPDRRDPALGEAAAKFLAHPRLRPAALGALASLWGDRAGRPLMDALESAEEPARIVAVTELRKLRGIAEQALAVIERLLTMKGSASEELRVAAAAALADAAPSIRARAITLLGKGVEGKRGFVAMLRGDGATDESVAVTEAMARSLLSLDRAEGTRAIRARLPKSDPLLKARLSALLG